MGESTALIEFQSQVVPIMHYLVGNTHLCIGSRVPPDFHHAVLFKIAYVLDVRNLVHS